MGKNFRETLSKQLSNPSLSTLKRLAEGLGMRLKLEFVPVKDISLTSGKK